jgi:hypothetical protein
MRLHCVEVDDMEWPYTTKEISTSANFYFIEVIVWQDKYTFTNILDYKIAFL